MPKTLIIIAGPTAVGKTNLGVEIAKHYKTEIISADSRQFFKETTIGTAKPSKEELLAVKHHFIDSHSITQEFSVGHYEKKALEVLSHIFTKHDYAVMVGGSGLYVNAVINGFDELPEIDPTIRNILNKKLEELGLSSLQEELEKTDPEYYQIVDINNPQRVIRALEVFYSSGNPFSSFRTGIKRERPFKTILIGLNMNREKLYERINRRVDIMIEQGLIDEVKSLIPYQKLNSLNTVGYTEIFEYLNGNISLERAVELIKQNSRRYAKRQITWFKKMEGIKWYEPNQKEDIISYIEYETKSS